MARDIFRLAYDVGMLAGSSDTAEVKLYGEIVEDGPSWWKTSQEDKSAAEFDNAIKKVVEDGAKNLLLRINSPGGIVSEATAMRSILGNAGFDKVTIRIEGMCASAATYLATLTGAYVEIAEGSLYMIHNPWIYACGTASDLEHTAERMRNIEQMTNGFYTKRTGQAEEQIRTWMDAETWFTAQQAVEYGFADAVLEPDVSQKGMPAVACVSARAMSAMREIYKTVPDQIMELSGEPEEGTGPAVPANNVSNGTPVAGEPTEIHKKGKEEDAMDVKEITMDQLTEDNPALMQQIRKSAVKAERERLADIDALTVPGYEEMAKQAKEDGTSAMDFQKKIVAAMKEKGKSFMQQRQKETKPADGVAGGAPAGSGDEGKELMDNAKEIAAYASEYAGSGSDKGMY